MAKQYPLGSIFFATLVGSPLVTAYLFRKNLIALDQRHLATIPVIVFFGLGIGAQFYSVPPDPLTQLFMYAGPAFIVIYLYARYLRRDAPGFAQAQDGTKLRLYAKAVGIGVALNLFLTGLTYKTLGFIEIPLTSEADALHSGKHMSNSTSKASVTSLTVGSTRTSMLRIAAG